MFCGDFFPYGSGRYLVFILNGQPTRFEGLDIPNVCYVDRTLNEEGYICVLPGINTYFFTDCVLKSSPDWKQLGMMMPGYKLSQIKDIVRSVFPKYALKFDKIVDADDWIEIEWEIKIPTATPKRLYGVERKKKLPDGRTIVALVTPVRVSELDVFVVPQIISPTEAVVVKATYLPNGGKSSRTTLSVALPFKARKFPKPPKTPPTPKDSGK